MNRSDVNRKRRLNRLTRQERRRWDDDTQSPMALGCDICVDLGTCGGIHKRQAGISCMDDCCGTPLKCEAMCPNNPRMFMYRMREINGFELHSVPRATKLKVESLPGYVPHLYHGYRRGGVIE